MAKNKFKAKARKEDQEKRIRWDKQATKLYFEMLYEGYDYMIVNGRMAIMIWL